MNWRRGLFRTWLVLTAIWVTVIATTTGKDTFFRHKDVEVAVAGKTYVFPDTTPVDVISPAIAKEIRERSVKASSEGWVDMDQRTPEEQVRDALHGYAPFNYRNAIVEFLKVALLPPFVTLLLGSAVYWAISGFRRSSSNSA